MLNIKVSGILEITGYSDSLKKSIAKTLTIENPAYEKVARITGTRYACARFFKYYEIDEVNQVIKIPRGFLVFLKKHLENKGVEYQLEFDVNNKPIIINDFNFKMKAPSLRDYQVDLVNKMENAEYGGVVSSSTGSGKTIMALESIRRQRQRSFIFVPNKTLQMQFATTAKKVFDFEIGIVNGEQKNFKEITVGTWQIMNSPDIIQYVRENYADFYIDEAHGIVSEERQNIIKQMKPRKLYGLTATPRRSKDDGRTSAIFFYLGEIIAEYRSNMLKPQVRVIRDNSPISILGTYAEMIDRLIECENRNTLIKGIMLGEIVSGRKILILTKRKSHAEELYRAIEHLEGAYILRAEDKERFEILEKINDGEVGFCAIVGTMALLGTGTDIPALDTLLFAEGPKSDVLTEQGVGRILRLFEGKTKPLIYDIMDMDNRILKNQFYERKRFYEKHNWEII